MYQKKHYNKGNDVQDDEGGVHDKECDESDEEDNIDVKKNNDQLRKNNFLDSENRKIIISTRVLMNDEDQFRNDIIKKCKFLVNIIIIY